MSGSTAGVMAVGLLLLIEIGQSMRTGAESSYCFQESSKARPAHAQKMLSFGAQPLKPPPENPTLARKCLAQKANTSGLYRLELALPERHKQHDNGK